MRSPGSSSGLLLIAAVAFALACSSAPTVTRRDADEAIDLSGYWNDTDSRLVSEDMVEDALSNPWSDRAREALGRDPRVVIGRVRNRSQEHLDTRTFVKDLERALLGSGWVEVVAAPGEREGLRTERLDQQTHASIETAKSMGKELGADFMLIGGINTIIDAAGKMSVRFYQIELELVDLETNEKVWIGQKKLKKVVKNARTRF
jgi:uncharacterized protein (TIGR02722 family)